MKNKLPPLHPRALSQNKIRYDQNLVADQSGRAIFFSGFFVALFLGLLFRGLTSPQKVQKMVNEAASKIHKNMDVHFEGAEVSLSQNGFPRIAVVINNVEINSDLACWGKPKLMAKQIILPFSLISMVFENQPFKKIIATEVDLRFRAAYEVCPDLIENQKQNKSSDTGVTLVHRRKDMEAGISPSIDRLEIDQLKVKYDLVPQRTIELDDLALMVKSHQPKVIQLKANTHLLNIFGQVLMEYKEFPEKEMMLHFFGNWREGSYSVNADYKFSDTTLTTNVELKHIPAAQVMAALKDYGWFREDFDGRKIWVTMKGHSQGKVKEWKKTPITLNNVRIEGDIGEIQVDEFQAHHLKPFLFKPLLVQIKKLNINRFLEFIKKPHKLSFLGDLGEFNGRFELINDHEMQLVGQQRGLEFIFSNRGQRQVQKLTSAEGTLKLRDNKWEFVTQDVVLDQGKFEGDLKVTSDRGLKKINFLLNAENLILAAPVQKLMTGLDQQASFKSQVRIQVHEGQLENLTGFIRSSDLTVDQIHFEKLNSQFDMKNETVRMQMTAQALKVAATAKAINILSRLVGSENEALNFKQLAGRFEIKSNRELKWQGLSASLDGKPLKISSDGQWSTQGLLDGKISVTKNNSISKWFLRGHRDQPQIEVQP